MIHLKFFDGWIKTTITLITLLLITSIYKFAITNKFSIVSDLIIGLVLYIIGYLMSLGCNFIYRINYKNPKVSNEWFMRFCLFFSISSTIPLVILVIFALLTGKVFYMWPLGIVIVCEKRRKYYIDNPKETALEKEKRINKEKSLMEEKAKNTDIITKSDFLRLYGTKKSGFATAYEPCRICLKPTRNTISEQPICATCLDKVRH